MTMVYEEKKKTNDIMTCRNDGFDRFHSNIFQPFEVNFVQIKKDIEKKKRNTKRDSCILDLRQVYARK